MTLLAGEGPGTHIGLVRRWALYTQIKISALTLIPCIFQMVRAGLDREGIRVPSVRLNGSAATHVLSDNGKHPYKDLDLIFSIDLSEYNDSSASSCFLSEHNENSNNSYCKTKGYKTTGKKTQSCRINGLLKPAESETATGKISSTDVSVASADDEADPSNVLIKDIAAEDEEVDLEDKESG